MEDGNTAWVAGPDPQTALLPEDESDHHNQQGDCNHQGGRSEKPVAGCQWLLKGGDPAEEFTNI